MSEGKQDDDEQSKGSLSDHGSSHGSQDGEHKSSEDGFDSNGQGSPKIEDNSPPSTIPKDDTEYQSARGFSLDDTMEEEKNDNEENDDGENKNDSDSEVDESERRDEEEFARRMKVEKEEEDRRSKMAAREERQQMGNSTVEDRYANDSEKEAQLEVNERRVYVKKCWDKHPLIVSPYAGITTRLMQCVILREPGGNGMFLPSYSLYFQGSDQPAMIALLQGKNRTTNYHIFDMTRGIVTKKLSKKSGNYLGKLRSNFHKTENILYTNDSRKVEAGSIAFDRPGIMDQISLGSQPRKLHILLPELDENGQGVVVESDNRSGQVDTRSKMVSVVQQGGGQEYYTVETKEPVFENGNYRLNFHGRVTIPSVKNFQLTPVDDIHDIVCQFGKVGENRFHLDYCRPLNAFQAFSIALTQFSL